VKVVEVEKQFKKYNRHTHTYTQTYIFTPLIYSTA